MSCARHPLPWPGSLEPASPGLAACRSSPPFGPWNFAAFGSTPWDERRARPLGHGGAREDAPRGTLASADAARLPPDTRQGVQQPRLRTLVARYIKTLALIRWRESPVVHTPRHPRASHPGPRVRPPETPRQPSRPVLASGSLTSGPACLTARRFDPPGSNQQRNQAPHPSPPHPRPLPRLPLGPKVVGRLWAVSCPGWAEPSPGGHYACSANGEGARPLTPYFPLRPPGGGSGGARPGEVPKV